MEFHEQNCLTDGKMGEGRGTHRTDGSPWIESIIFCFCRKSCISLLETIKIRFSACFVSYYLNKQNVAVIEVYSNCIFILFCNIDTYKSVCVLKLSIE